MLRRNCVRGLKFILKITSLVVALIFFSALVSAEAKLTSPAILSSGPNLSSGPEKNAMKDNGSQRLSSIKNLNYLETLPGRLAVDGKEGNRFGLQPSKRIARQNSKGFDNGQAHPGQTQSNTLPAIQNLSIIPNTPTTHDNLTVDYALDSNIEGKAEIRWVRNGFIASLLDNNITVLSSNTVPGDTWCVVARPFVGEIYGDWTEPTCVSITGSSNSSWSWQSTQPYLEEYISCPTITICYAVGWNGLILKTSDGGATWVPQNSGTNQPLLGVNCPAADICVAVGGNGTILATDNGGLSWNPQQSGTIYYLSKVSCQTTTICFAVGEGGAILFNNGGETWTAQNSGTDLLLDDIDCLTLMTCFAVGAGGVILRTDNRGGTWTDQSLVDFNQSLKDIDCPSPTACYAVGVADTILATRDGGLSWNIKREPSSGTFSSIDCPTEEDCFVVGTGSTVDITTDGWDTWDAEGITLSYTDYTGIDCPQVDICFATEFYGPISVTVDGGQTWQRQDLQDPTLINSKLLLDIDCPTADRCYAVGWNGTIMLKANQGSNWISLPGTSQNHQDISCSTPDLCVAVSYNGNIVRTTNGGTTWTSHYSSGRRFGVNCPTVTRCFAVGVNGEIIVSDDGGNNWTAQNSGVTDTLSGISCPTETSCIAISFQGTILTTDNGGTIWTVQSSGTYTSLYGVSCPTPTICFVASYTGIVLTTDDGGKSWDASSQPVTGSWPYGLIDIDCPSSTICYAVTYAERTIATTDGGETWSAQPTGVAFLSAISCPTPTACYTLGHGGAFLTQNNSPPEIQNLRIMPQAPTTNDDLEVEYEYDDADSDPEPANTLIRWYLTKNGDYEHSDELQPLLNNQKTVPSSSTLLGDKWCVVVYPYDGKIYGQKAGPVCVGVTRFVASGNTPPQAVAVISPTLVTPDEALSLNYSYSDLNGDDENVAETQFRWYRDGTFQPFLLNQATVPSEYTYPGETWCATVRPQDIQGDYGPEANSNCIIIGPNSGNGLPVAGNTELNPVQPKENQSLSLIYEYSDPNGDAAQPAQIHWYRDNVLQPAFNDTLTVPSAALQPGEIWHATVRAYDGQNYGLLVETAPIRVRSVSGNTSPQVHNIRLMPAKPGVTDDLVLEYYYLDPDGDPEGLRQIKWFKNGEHQAIFDGKLRVPGAVTNIDEIWYAMISPYDGQNFGSLVFAYTVKIRNDRENVPPQVDNIVLSPGKPGLNDRLRLSYNYVDPDGDPETDTEIKWFSPEGERIEFRNQTVVPGGNTSVGQWCVTIRPHDGAIFGQETSPTCVIVGEVSLISQPEAQNVYITPRVLHAEMPLKLVYTYFDRDRDAEDDSLIRWFKNGSPQSQYDGQTVVPASATKPGDTWSVEVTPHDGNEFGFQIKATSVNVVARPQFTEVRITPPLPNDDDPLSCCEYDPPSVAVSSLRVKWFRGDDPNPRSTTVICAGASSSILSDVTGTGDSWYAEVTPRSDDLYGLPATSNPVVIGPGDSRPPTGGSFRSFLPLVMSSGPLACSLETYEPNDKHCSACEVDPTGIPITARADDPGDNYKGEARDWYKINLDETSMVNVDAAPSYQGGQIIMFNGDQFFQYDKEVPRGEQIDWDSDRIDGKFAFLTDCIPPLDYYIVVYTDLGNINHENIVYNLVIQKETGDACAGTAEAANYIR